MLGLLQEGVYGCGTLVRLFPLLGWGERQGEGNATHPRAELQ